MNLIKLSYQKIGQILLDKLMFATHKQVYYRKPKPQQRARFNADPISIGMRASILSKFDDIYGRIENLHNKNSFINTFVSSKNSFSAPKSSSLTQRKSQDMSRMGKTVYASTSRNFNNKLYASKRSRGQVEYENRYRTDNLTIAKKPYSQINIRQLLQKRCKIEQVQTNNLRKNPYYKIMKKRVKTEFRVQKQAEEHVEIGLREAIKLKTECLTQSIASEDNLLESHYSFHEKRDYKKIPNEHEHQFQGIRQKSQTKVYEQIKKYFEEKYGNYRSVQKK